ncbi:MAG: LPS assembly lipoprotein LptE [Bacteroidota bacterium]
MIWRIIKSVCALCLLLFLSNCGIYSFTGASISPDVKNISIQTFFNNAPLGPSNMSVVFTEKIKDYFQQNTNLELTDSNGDLQIDGYISNYTITPVAATAGGGQNQFEVSEQSRITITVSASYINIKDPTFDFDQTFSFFRDFDTNADLASEEEAFVDEIFDQIVLDIFNASVANW